MPPSDSPSAACSAPAIAATRRASSVRNGRQLRADLSVGAVVAGRRVAHQDLVALGDVAGQRAAAVATCVGWDQVNTPPSWLSSWANTDNSLSCNARFNVY
jgi:hypothetical protein